MALWMPAAAMLQPQAAPAPIVIDGKFDTVTEQLLIPVQFDRTRLWCSLDSGMSALLVVDPGKGVPARAAVTIGPVALGSREIILRRLPAEAPEMECVVGTSILHDYVVETNYIEPRVRLFDRQTYRPSANAQLIPLIYRTNPNVPFIRVVIRDHDGREHAMQMVTDTGASYYAAVVVQEAAAQMGKGVGPIAAPANRPESPGGPLRLVAARPEAIKVGPIEIPQPVIALLESPLNGGGVDDGLLGLGFFRRFTVTFDFEGHRLFLEPNRHASEPQAFDASGAGFLRQQDGYRVDVVLADTPASRAGIRAGDVLTEIDGRAALQVTSIELRELLSKDGETRALILRRDGETVKVSLKLEKRL